MSSWKDVARSLTLYLIRKFNFRMEISILRIFWAASIKMSRILTLAFELSDLRSCKQRQRYFSFFCNRLLMDAWSLQPNSSRSYLYPCSWIVFVIHHYDDPHQLYIYDNAVITSCWVNRVSVSSPNWTSISFFTGEYLIEYLVSPSSIVDRLDFLLISVFYLLNV